ncbi:MAG: tetratricopeptide repeat protein [Longimicrobiales bacterium]
MEPLLERAHTLGEEGDWEGAAELLNEHLDEFGEEPALHCWLGVAERELGLAGVAYDRFKRTLELEPTDPYILATAGSGIARFDDLDAERALRTAALTAPEVAFARLMYGAYLAREGFVEDAIRELLAARELDPDDPLIAYELGVAYGIAGRIDEACDALADAVRLDPEDGWVRTVFGLLLLEGGRDDEGAGELISGARASPQDVDAQIAAALAASASGLDDIAYEMLERARMLAAEGDLALVADVEERIDAGGESVTSALREDFGPDLLRGRLQERP